MEVGIDEGIALPK